MLGKKPVPRIAFYSHDTMGLGHVRRNMLLASAVLSAIPDAETLLISGVHESGSFFLPHGMDIITLPTYLKTPQGQYVPRSLGKDVTRLAAIRSGIIRAALDNFEPDIFIVDNVPRGAMSELDCILPILSQKKVNIILGLRDVIDEPDKVRQQWTKLENDRIIEEYYSGVMVYGDDSFYDLSKAYGFSEKLQQITSFIGYLDATQRQRPAAAPVNIAADINRPYALCVVGGGQDGFQLASTFCQATFPQGTMGVLIAGSMMPLDDYRKLQQIALARNDLIVLRFVPEPLELLRHAMSIVAMGGYNTTIEILSLHKRALIVPRISPRLEQWIRASLLADRDLITCRHPDDLTLTDLNTWLEEDQKKPDPRAIINFKGLENFSQNIKHILRARHTPGEIFAPSENVA